MKRHITLFFAAIATFAACTNTSNMHFTDYATVEIGKEESKLLKGISDNGKEVLNLYRFAAMEADNIYWQQAFGDKAVIDSLEDGAVKDFAILNYGPWDHITGKAFIPGYPRTRPAGVCFYPDDMSDEEFHSFNDPYKYSPYTLIRRDENGKLKCVWYHEAYAENVARICNYLRAAADITIVPSVREYLLAQADALASDNYRNAVTKWLEMDNSRMDLVIGPTENQDDNRFGIKRSYSAYVVLKDLKTTARLSKFTDMLSQMQESLPCDEKYNYFMPGDSSNIFVCDAIYYAGEANVGVKDVAVNLPFDSAIQAEMGTRTILMKNIINAKFNHIVFPLSQLMLCDEDKELVDNEAFFWNAAFREIAHGLGIKKTLDGAEVSEVLGHNAGTIEEAKAIILGVYFSTKMIDGFKTDDYITSRNAFATFLAGMLRASRFGGTELIGKGNLICYNYLKEKGAFERHPDGCYYINWPLVGKAVSSLAAELLEIQAVGDYEYAEDFVELYTRIDSDLNADMHNLRLEKIPADIKFKFVW